MFWVRRALFDPRKRVKQGPFLTSVTLHPGGASRQTAVTCLSPLGGDKHVTAACRRTP